ncbi:hypothetical protein AAY473_013634 [Plecturocebus cupreus]
MDRLVVCLIPTAAIRFVVRRPNVMSTKGYRACTISRIGKGKPKLDPSALLLLPGSPNGTEPQQTSVKVRAWWLTPVILALWEAEAGGSPELLGRLRQENLLNPGGENCSELRWHHCTPAWVTRAKLCLKQKVLREDDPWEPVLHLWSKLGRNHQWAWLWGPLPGWTVELISRVLISLQLLPSRPCWNSLCLPSRAARSRPCRLPLQSQSSRVLVRRLYQQRGGSSKRHAAVNHDKPPPR